MIRIGLSLEFLLIGGFACASAATVAYDLEARRLIDREQFQAALNLLDRARHEEPKNAEVLYLRGYALYRLHDLEKARMQLEEVTQLSPPALRARYFLGRIAMLQGRPEEAIRWLKAPAQQSSPIEDSPAQLGQAYLNAHQLEAARDWTNKALKITPWDGSLHYRLARIHQQLGDNDTAAKEFRSSLDL